MLRNIGGVLGQSSQEHQTQSKLLELTDTDGDTPHANGAPQPVEEEEEEESPGTSGLSAAGYASVITQVAVRQDQPITQAGPQTRLTGTDEEVRNTWKNKLR